MQAAVGTDAKIKGVSFWLDSLFCDGATHKVKLTEAYLKVRKVKVSPSVSIAHELALKKGPAIYPVRRVECKTFIIPTGNPSLRKDNLDNGLVPKTFVFGMVDSAAFNGDYTKNPFNFKTLTASFIGITVNGEVPFKPLQLSYTDATSDIWRPTSACSPVPESYFTILEMAFHATILKMAMLCMLPTLRLTCVDPRTILMWCSAEISHSISSSPLRQQLL